MEFFRKKKIDFLNPREVLKEIEEEVSAGFEERLAKDLEERNRIRREGYVLAAKFDAEVLADLKKKVAEAEESLRRQIEKNAQEEREEKFQRLSPAEKLRWMYEERKLKK